MKAIGLFSLCAVAIFVQALGIFRSWPQLFVLGSLIQYLLVVITTIAIQEDKRS